MGTMSNVKYFLKRYKNKIGAIGFISLALAFYLAFYLAVEIISGWTYFRSDVFGVWNFLITLVCYLYLLVTNIRNDNAAYTGIFMFVSLIVLQGVFTIIDTIRVQSSAFYTDNPPIIATFVVYCVLLAVTIVVGVLFYISTFRYMAGRTNSFGRLRGLALGFGGALLVMVAVLMVFYGYAAVLTSPVAILLAIAVPVSELFAAVGIIFTLERLRRV